MATAPNILLKSLDKFEEKRQKAIVSALHSLYPETKSELNFKNSYQLVIAVSLSAQCTDKKVNEVTPSLFKKFKDFKSLANAKIVEIEKIIRPINYYITKAKNIRALSKTIISEFDGKLPEDHAVLMTLPGIGRKTANVVLSELHIRPSIPVDTHVFRVSKRLAFSDGKNPEAVEKDLEARFDQSLWYNLHHWLIYHGRRVCKAQRPLCEACIIEKYCPSSLLKEGDGKTRDK